MMKKLLFLSLLLAPVFLYAQMDLGTHFMKGVWQSTFTNPAFTPEHNLVISLPGVYNNLQVTNFTYNDIVRTDEEGRDFLSVNTVIDKLEDENLIRDQFDLPTLHLGIDFGRTFISFGHNFRLNAFGKYPKELPQLLWQGNAQFIGQEVQIAPDLFLQAYHEFFVSTAIRMNENLTIGARMKVLSGVGDVSTTDNDLRIFTSDDVYQTTLTGKYGINSTGILAYDGLNNTDFSFNDQNFNTENIFNSNNGLGFDIGIEWETGGWTLAASVLDLGYITWQVNAERYTLEGSYEYKGLDVLRDALVDSLDNVVLIDTLDALYDIQQVQADYTTNLPTRYYLSATRNWDSGWRGGVLMYGEYFRDEFFPGFALSLQRNFTNYLALGGIYSIRQDTYNNLGLNMALRLGPVQLMLATDNILTTFEPGDHNNANIRLGANLVFGKNKEEKE